LRALYRSYEDEQVVEFALTAAADLTPKAIEVLKVELASRRLVPALWPTLDIRVDAMSREALDAVVRRVQFMPCPMCGKTRTSLNAYVTQRQMIPLLVNRVGFYLGCEPCLANVGAWRLFSLKPGERWKPSDRLRQWVNRHAALFIHFEANAPAMAALLRFDYQGFLDEVREKA
jgi:hypothetical protein